jgi:hypothetical protein
MSFTLQRVARICCVVLGASLLAGCVPPATAKFATSVSALRASSLPPSRSFWIASGMAGVAESDLQFQESRRFLVAALRQQGFVEASSPASAAIAVFLSYGIGNPTQETYEYLVPQVGFVPKSTTVNGTVTASGKTSTISGTAATQSTLGITGFGSAVGSYTTFTRYLLVTALDLDHYRSTKEATELWKTAVISVGASNDFRLVLPYLVVAGTQYLGASTDHIVDQEIAEDDRRVVALKLLAQSGSK